ncbi:MAG: hypothetical protein J3K34DRAFT_386704 [Monoraphidium minutum]|nr:MAG: hypothetical protein J3K34DRAFT_386704 [Monoraphidium minutum]
MAPGACALACGPLVSLHPVFRSELLKVQAHLDEPLMQRVDVREVVCLAAVLDVAAERVQKVKGASFTQQQRLARLEVLCRTLAPQQKPADTLAALGVFDFYPYLAALMCGHQWGPGVQQAGAAYLNYVSLLNQVVMMGTQLYNDAVVPQHHKYAAHQIALLYQSLNMLQGETKPIRRLVEARFDEIKAITEGSRPLLAPDTSSW